MFTMRARFAPALDLVQKVIAEFTGDGVPRMAAALAYYTIFSLAPLLVIAISVIGLVLGPEAAQGQLMTQIEDAVGNESAAFIQGMIARMNSPAAGIISAVIGFVTILVGASGVLTELQTDLNLIWDVKPPVRKGWLGFVMGYLQPMAMVLIVGLVIIASMALSTVLGALSGALRQIAPWLGVLSALLDVLVTLASTTLAFGMAFKFLPGVRLGWRDVWVGALVTALLFGAGKYLITLYLTRTGAGSPYGAAGALVVLLMFVFYASQIFLLGAEFTQVWARTRGSRMREANLLIDPVSWRGTVESDKMGVQDVMNAAAGRIKRP